MFYAYGCCKYCGTVMIVRSLDSMICYQNTTLKIFPIPFIAYHPGLSRIPAPVGLQEVMLYSRAFTLQTIGMCRFNLVMMKGWPNLHRGKHWPISSANLWVCLTTSCDPTGAWILDNQGWYRSFVLGLELGQHCILPILSCPHCKTWALPVISPNSV